MGLISYKRREGGLSKIVHNSVTPFMDDPYKCATGCARDRDLYKLVCFGKFEIKILFVLFIKHSILLWGITP